MSLFSRRKIINEFRSHVSRYKARFYSRFGFTVVMGKREGIYFWDINQKRYINLHCNGGVFNLGHKNELVVDTMQKALQDFDIGNHHLISGPRARLAKELCKSLKNPTGLYPFQKKITNTVFAVSGGEAIDLAIKIARGYTKKAKIISLFGGYHGHTGLALATGDEKYRKSFGIDLPDFLQINFQDLETIENHFCQNTAAVILETVPATLGMPIISREVMKHIRKQCSKRNIVLILDEIQTGLGRTGKNWGFHHYDITPDIVVSGKGLSGGVYPIAATCFKKKYETVFKKDPFIHISTFGGSEAGCITALRVLQISTDKIFQNKVKTLADFFEIELTRIQQEYPQIIEIRQLGLFIGIVFENEASCITMVKSLYDNGVFAVYANNDKRVLQFLPPLITTPEEASQIITAFRKSLDDLSKLKYRLTQKLIRKFF